MAFDVVARYSRCFTRSAVFIMSIMLLVSGCSQDKQEKEQVQKQEKEPVRLVYVDWESEKASAHVIKAVIQEKLHRDCELMTVSLHAMWQSLAAGDQDASVAAWLPSLQGDYLKKYGNKVRNLGINLKGTRIGLVVPEYVEIESIKELKEHREKFASRIVGIDPGAGIMGRTSEAMDLYGLNDFELISGSGPTMTVALKKAVEEKRWIVVTGWTPHWKFAKWDLKYLKDPKGVYGQKEHISTIVREGLENDMPGVFNLLQNFKWNPDDMEQVMLFARDEEMDYYQAAKRWVSENEAQVEAWLEN
ncbi:MAG: glycine betaine ABC transporter substrate-binding protein [Thermodesulfobacteriota bacterium]